MRASVSTSRALEMSSITRSSGRRTKARAAAVRWIWPPERRTPLAPTTVARPSGIQATSSSRHARRTASCEPVGLDAEEDGVGQRLAEQARHLRHVGGAGRHEHLRRVVDQLAVPAQLAVVERRQAEQAAQQGGLAGADRAGDGGERAARHGEVDVVDAAAAGMGGGEPADGELAEGVVAGALVGRGDGRGAERARAVPQRERRRRRPRPSGRGRAAAGPCARPTRRPGGGRRRCWPPSAGGWRAR